MRCCVPELAICPSWLQGDKSNTLTRGMLPSQPCLGSWLHLRPLRVSRCQAVTRASAVGGGEILVSVPEDSRKVSTFHSAAGFSCHLDQFHHWFDHHAFTYCCSDKQINSDPVTLACDLPLSDKTAVACENAVLPYTKDVLYRRVILTVTISSQLHAEYCTSRRSGHTQCVRTPSGTQCHILFCNTAVSV